jgi:hypothetical protein
VREVGRFEALSGLRRTVVPEDDDTVAAVEPGLDEAAQDLEITAPEHQDGERQREASNCR